MVLIGARFVSEPGRQAKGRALALREERLAEGLDFHVAELQAFFRQYCFDERSPRICGIESQSSRRQRQQEVSELRTLSFIEATVHRQLAKAQVDWEKLFRPAELGECPGQDSIPQIALVCGQVKAA